MDVVVNDLRAVLKALPKAGFVGVNVTIPHKETVLEFADHVTDRAALIGAANTLIFRTDGKIHADNTDAYGFIENLKQNAPGWSAASGPAAILGAGGASRAVVAALLESGAPEVRVSNRTGARSQKLRADFGARVTVYDWGKFSRLFEGAATVINTTSLGMEGKPEMSVNLEAIAAGTVVCDLVYAPLHTPFLATAEAQGARIVDGLGMLLHQAVPGFERWFGKRPEVTQAAREAVLGP
jgi:shikimate dehydrogenase